MMHSAKTMETPAPKVPTWAESVGALFAKERFSQFFIATTTLGMALSFVIPFLALWGANEIGFTKSQLGLFTATTSIAGVGIATLLARLSDTRLSRKAVLMLGSGCGAAGYASYAVVREPVFLVLFSLPLVAISSICFSQSFAAARDWFTPGGAERDAAVMTSFVRICFSLAWTVGPSLGAFFLARAGFEGLFTAAGALYLAFFLWAWRSVPSRLRMPEQTRAAASVPVWKTLRRPEVSGYCAASTLIFAAFAVNVLNLPLVVVHGLGGTVHDVGAIFSIGPLVEIPCMLLFGRLAAKGHTKNLLRCGAFVASGYFLGLFFSQSVGQIFLVQGLNGVAHAILANVAIVHLQNLVPGQPGLAAALYSGSVSVGNLLGYGSYGALSSWAGSQRTFLVCSGVAAVISVAFVFSWRQRNGNRRDSH
ncbi:MAG TPA: sugar efflux transporter [Opitutaceae bacterium]